MATLLGRETTKVASATAGETVALGKLDQAATGDVLVPEKAAPAGISGLAPAPSLYAIERAAEGAQRRGQAVGCTVPAGRGRPVLTVEHNQSTGETILHGTGEMHLRIALERLENRAQISFDTHQPSIGYRETISKPVTQRGRHKKQSGGHGQYGDVVLEIRPLEPGGGFEFSNTIVGGAVPKQFIGSVEAGVKEYLQSGPLGFPVVDLAVNLSDGSYHTVDSSDMAFQLAGKLAMREGLPQCGPVLLEPVMKVAIHTPSEATASVTAIIPQRRGQILGFRTASRLARLGHGDGNHTPGHAQ
jgi:elongation factor G